MDAQAQSFSVNGIRVDFATETVRDSTGEPIPLRPQSFAVLRALTLNAGRLVTKQELMSTVWPDVAVTDDSLVQCVHEIRQALRDDSHTLLLTVARRGYRLVLPEAETQPIPPESHRPAKRPAWIVPAALSVAVIVLAALAAWLLPPLWQRPATPGGPPVIAVLPFDNLGSDAAEDYFADGITEDLITDLSRISGVEVIARNTVWRYRGQAVDVQQVASELGVQYLLEGSVRREGDELRINAQLIDATDAHHLWAERYDGKVTEVFALQDQVIGRIVSALAVKLTTTEQAITGETETASPQAYDAVLRGLDFLHRDTEDATAEAIAQFEHAVELDPHYARAHAALAAANWRIVQSFWYSSSGPNWVHAYEAYKTHLALSLEHPSSLAYATQAWQFEFEGRYPEAFATVDKAMALAPGDADNHAMKARILNAIGKAEEAEAEVRLAMRLDPGFAPATLRVLSISLLHQRRYQDCVDILERIKAQDAIQAEDYWSLVASYGHLGRVEDAQQAIEEFNRKHVPAFYEPMSVQDVGWFFGGDSFDYYQPYVDDVLDGLRKAGTPPGAGADLPLTAYKPLMTRSMGEYAIKGATKIDPPTAKALFDRGVKFVDTRSHLEYLRSHVPGALGVSLSTELTKEALAKVVRPDEEVVFYCHGKYCSVSPYAVAKAVAWGWIRVYYFADGFPGWQDAGYPVEGE